MKRTHFILVISYFLASVLILSGCSSSTSPSSSSGASSFIAIPSNVNFDSIPIGQWHDTTISLVNSGTGFVIITSNSLSSAEVRDTNFAHAILIGPQSITTIHLQFNPLAAGAQSATDQINYSIGGTNASVTITFQAVGSGSASGGGVTPGSGSTFTYAVDTSGVPQGDSTYTVVSNSLSFAGKTNVLEVSGPTGDLNYYHFESNGDVTYYLDLSSYSAELIAFGITAPLPSTWITIPLGSKQQTSNILFDSSLTLTGIPLPVQVIISDTGRFLGTSSVTTAGKTFQTSEGTISLAINASVEGLLTVFSAENETEIWYASTLGYYPKRQDVSSNTQNTTGTGGTTTATTTNYLLKSYNVVK